MATGTEELETVRDDAGVWPEGDGITDDDHTSSDGIEDESQVTPDDDPEDNEHTEKSEEVKDDPKDTKADEPEAKENSWDKEHQERDQERANELRSLKSTNTDLSDQIAELRDRLDNPQKSEAPEVDPFEDLDEDADAADVVAAIKQSNQTIREQKKELAELRKDLGEQRDRDTQREEKAEADAGEKAYQSIHAKLHTEYGEKYHAGAVKAAQEYFEERGYSRANRPSAVAVELVLEREYRKAFDADPKRKTKPKPTPPTLDPGSGGGPAATPKTGSMDDVYDEMKKEGKFNDD